MSLTKHQKLARGIKSLLDTLDNFHLKVAKVSNVLQFHFYETHLILGRPLITEKALAAMMHTHRYALRIFSPNEKMREAANSAPLIGIVLTPQFYLRSRVCFFPPGASNVIWHVPWGVKTVLPQENLQKLKESILEALLFCASDQEMSAWIEWYEPEDKANTLTNQLVAIYKYFEKRSPILRNFHQLAFDHYQKLVLQYQDLKIRKRTLRNADFAPSQTTTVAEAYMIISESIKSHKKRYLDDFQRTWMSQLEELIFTGLTLTSEQKNAILEEYFPKKRLLSKQKPGARWETSHAIDRQTYGKFIRYFAEKFIENPDGNEYFGEAALLLWIMVYIGRKPNKIHTLKRLLELTTANVSEARLLIDNTMYELSQGLADLIEIYAGARPMTRQQKLFPNLTEDKLETLFSRASREILPPDSTPALPGAFLTFPHPHRNVRMRCKLLREIQQHPPQVYHDPISRHELKRQLIEKSTNLPQ